MKQKTPQLHAFVDAFLHLSQDALRFSRDYVERSAKEPRNPELARFFRNALGVVKTLQRELDASTKSSSRRKK